MVPNIYSKIIQRLAQKTEKGEVNWETTSSPNKFLVNFKNFSMAVDTFWSQDGEEGVSFELLDPNGKRIDYFSVPDSDAEWWPLANELYAGARRKALRIDEAVKTISEELGVDDNHDVPF